MCVLCACVLVSVASLIGNYMILIILLQSRKVKDPTDGVWAGTKYFKSKRGRGKFVPLIHLKPFEGMKIFYVCTINSI